MNGRAWTTPALKKLRDLYAEHLTLEVARLIGHSQSSTYMKAASLGLKKSLACRRRLRAAQPPSNGKAWTEEQLRKLCELYPHRPTAQLAKLVGHSLSSVFGMAGKLGLKKTAAYLATSAACRLRRGDNVGFAFRFPKGHVPANKGLRRPGYSPGRMAETQFKKGQRPANHCRIGTVAANSKGYLRVKVSATSNGKGASDKAWEFVHRRVWEAAHGPIPKGHRIWWKDGNHENCALENLELLSDAEHMARTTIHNWPPELKSTIVLAGALKRRIRRMEKNNGEEPPLRSPGSSL